MRCFVIGYTAKGRAKEFTSVKGYQLPIDERLPSYKWIKNDCLAWANAEGGNFNYLQINFITEMAKGDYESFMSA